MGQKIRFSKKLKPLFRLKTRYAVVIGGRSGGKSFGVASAVGLATYDDAFNILYTRYTMASAEISVIPEFMDNLALLNSDGDFRIRRNDVVNKGTGSRVYFRGIKTGSGNQTANLKSLHNVKWWVLDEAEELDREETFDTIDDSLRHKDADIHVILVLNQADVHHWIYRRFFKEPGVPEGFNGVKGNVTYISVSWEDNRMNLNQTLIDKIEALRLRNPEKYEHMYGFKWKRNKQGAIYTNWKEITEEEWPSRLPQWWGQDWGTSDWPNACVRMCYDPLRGIIYVRQITTGPLCRDAAKAIIRDGAQLYHHTDQHVNEDGTVTEVERTYRPSDCEVYCDPAGAGNILEFRTIHDLSAMKGYDAQHKSKSGRIHFLQGFRVHFIGDDIAREQESYTWKENPHDRGTFLDEPQDGGDHYMDAISYASMKLVSMGVNGEV